MTISNRRPWIAPGDEFRHDKALLSLKSRAASSEQQFSAVRIGDLAAGGRDNGMSRRDVPFAGRGKAGIDIGAAFGHPAELERRAEHLTNGAVSLRDEGFGAAVQVRAAHRHDAG